MHERYDMFVATDPRPPDAAVPSGGDPAPPAARDAPLVTAGRHVERGVRAVWQTLLERRGLRLAVIGAVLVLVALDVGTGSAVGLVLVIAGLAMLVVGAMGPRLSGRVAIDFGPDGASLQVHTQVAPPGRTLPAALPEAAPRPHISLVSTGDATVVEGSGETVEIDVEQIRAALAGTVAGPAERQERSAPPS